MDRESCPSGAEVLGIDSRLADRLRLDHELATPPALIANIVTALAIFNYDQYEPKNWHTTLIMWGLILVPVVFNVWRRRLLNPFEIMGGVFHVVFFITSVVTLIKMGRPSSSDYVFNTFTVGESGWSNRGVSWALGLLTITFSVSGKPGWDFHTTRANESCCLIGFDGVLHMSKKFTPVTSARRRQVEP